MRLFVAVPVPADVRDRLAPVQRTMHGLPLRPARAEGLHVTLAFLGETAEEKVPTIRAQIDLVAREAAPVPLSIERLGCFPSVRRPRVVWAGIGGHVDVLVALQAHLVSGLRAAGFELEERPFRPHVTLGRAASAWTDEQLSALRAILDQAPSSYGAWTAGDIHLMRSELHRTGSRYSSVYARRLGT